MSSRWWPVSAMRRPAWSGVFGPSRRSRANTMRMCFSAKGERRVSSFKGFSMHSLVLLLMCNQDRVCRHCADSYEHTAGRKAH